MGGFFGVTSKSDCMMDVFFGVDYHSHLGTRQLINDLKKFSPDIIHLHNIHGYYLDIRVLFEYLRSCGKPILWSFYDCWSFTGHCAYFDFAGCDKWKTGCNHCPQKGEYPASMVLDSSCRNYEKKKDMQQHSKGQSYSKQNVCIFCFFHNRHLLKCTF